MIKIDVKKQLKHINLDVNLSIKEGEFISLYGQSGSGKTTLLRIIAGIEKSLGRIEVDSEIWLDEKKFLAPQYRDIGFVFQEHALFENFNVIDNLLYVKKDKQLANYLLDMANLKGLKQRYVHNLSGGEKQRVALCRALMKKPKILILDEPFSALDVGIKKQLQEEILKFHKKFNMTTIMVSHDPSEIYKLCNKVIVLKDGKIIEQGHTKEVLLKTKGSAKFSFEGELLDLIKVDAINIAIISIGTQIVEVVVSNIQTQKLKIGDKINVSTKAFSPVIN